jgi:hypothetical protein
MSNMVLVDNHYSFALNIVCPDDYAETEILIQDNEFYGESIVPDCLDGENGSVDGGFCQKPTKYATIFGGAIRAGKAPHNPSKSPRPHYNYMTEACWRGKYTMNDNKFYEFLGLTQTGENQYVFDMNPHASDMPPMVRGRNNEFINVDDRAFGYFYDPPAKWANVKDCGEFPCSAPFNVLMQMKQTKFTGIQPTFGGGVDIDNFQLIADNPGFAPYVPNCERREDNNMYICQQDDLGMLVWESLDADNRDRGMQPIHIAMEGTEMDNKVNAMMDHVWDGFYAGQVRESRFFAIVWPPKGSVYNMTFAGGSPAKKMRFEMRSDSNNVGMTVRIAYPSAEARKIIKDGQDVEMNEWNEKERNYGPVT